MGHCNIKVAFLETNKRHGVLDNAKKTTKINKNCSFIRVKNSLHSQEKMKWKWDANIYGKFYDLTKR